MSSGDERGEQQVVEGVPQGEGDQPTPPQGGEGQPAQQQQQPRPTLWQILRSILFQIMIFYFISSFFRGRQQPVNPDGTPATAGHNLFDNGQEMELYVYLTEWEEFDFERDRSNLFWNEELEYGNWVDGSYGDGTRVKTRAVSVPESVQQNGTWYFHIFLVKYGYPLEPEDESYSPQAIVYKTRLLNKYRKRRIHNTANLITGESDVAPGSMKVPQGTTDATPEVISYYHPNLTLNLVVDHTNWVEGKIPQPVDKYVEFDEETGGYYPILYLNDYWNLAQDYMPINETTPNITLTLTFSPISMMRFNLYAAMTRDNPWQQMFGSNDPSDEEQDTIKETLMETNPYLLGLTVVVSIVHSVFEFLAFKNDVQFWRSRKTLEGLSVRSVFFNVFQSFIVLLYILDNETNMVVIISVFIGLLIEMWKVTKVTSIELDRENLIAGVIPRISFVDRPSYQSSTKKYDVLAFKYLGCVLFPLFVCYGVYSLLYHEHKGWYSFTLSMCYGFLLTFGFITMTPQLFINYKLKSVAHLPWRMLTYKALNTFIDDMFAFVIKMPTMYRIGCFRDDIVFFIFLYQRWIYRVDPKRVNEFGTTGEDTVQPTTTTTTGGGASQPNGPEIKSQVDKKND